MIKNTPSMNLDTPSEVRTGEELNPEALEIYLNQLFQTQNEKLQIAQFPSGYSNLTYLISFGEKNLVLRRPPRGAENITKGHDMGREYKVLSTIFPHFNLAPKPLAYCEDKTIVGAPFFIMERVKGIILRAQDTLDWEASQVRLWNQNMIQTIVNLHAIPIHTPSEKGTLADLGKTEGYLLRQVEGWKGRWEKAKTEDVSSMQFVSEWLQANLPPSPAPTFLHNDFKYDNVVLNPENPTEIKAILDWEMATVGDPLTDLGIMLSYITETHDAPILLNFNFKPQNGSLTRQETAQYYAEKSGRSIDNMVYYYAFGTFKLGIIAQQIYYRYKMGYTQDKRFAPLGMVVKACGELAEKAIQTGKI